MKTDGHGQVGTTGPVLKIQGKTEVTAKASCGAFDAVGRSYWEITEAWDINKYKCAMLKLPALYANDEDDSMFGILSVYRRSTLHTSHVSELDNKTVLKEKSSQIQAKDVSTPACKKLKSRDQPTAVDMLYHKMLRNLSNGDDPKQRYSPIKLIDSGTFGHVILAKAKLNGSMVAIKIMEVKKQPFAVLANEVTIMKRICQENVVTALDAIYVEAVKKFWLVMEYVNGCSLKKI
ncbi:serine/threonine-protein kinase Sgk3-like, partial [Ruditapes philippinarum]|uniref:serine/threonine-protein kinase Sgk3-like n=1 Tax=Ruditapes philippinarum TaxID=129788 RepID=UPI00295A5C83